MNSTSCGRNSACSWLFLSWDVVDILLVVLTNGTTLLILKRNELLETSSNIFIACLTAGDLISTIALLFQIGIYYFLPGSGWLVSCFGYQLISNVSYTINIITLFVIAADRLIYFIRSLEYHSLVPVTKAVQVAYFIWGFSIVFNTSVLGFGYNYHELVQYCEVPYDMNRISRVFLAIPFLSLVPATIGIYIKIGLVALKKKQSPEAASVNQIHPTPPPSSDSKITRVMLRVLVVYITCNLGLLSIPVFDKFPALDHLLVARIGFAVWRVNRWINPFIYAGKSEKFRKHVRNLFGRDSNTDF